MLDQSNTRRAGGKTTGPPLDFQQQLEALEAAGLLVRIERPIDKDTELHPLVRWQFQGGLPEEKRRGITLDLGFAPFPASRDLAISVEKESVYADPTLVTDPAMYASQLAPVVGGEVEPRFDQPLPLHPRIKAEPRHQIGRHRLQHARPDPTEHIIGRRALDNDAIHPRLTQQMAEQQARRPCPDDRNLGLHVISPRPHPRGQLMFSARR